MLKRSGKRQEKKHINSILKSTLILLSGSCASFGMEDVAEPQRKDTNSLSQCSEVSAQETQEKPENDKSIFNMQDKNVPVKFLNDFVETLQELNKLEEAVIDFLPQHPRNPLKANNFLHKPTAWNLQTFLENLPVSNNKGIRTEPSWIDPTSDLAIKVRLSALDKKKSEHRLTLQKKGYSPDTIAKMLDDQEALQKLKKKALTESKDIAKGKSESSDILGTIIPRQELAKKLGVWFLEVSSVPTYKACTLKENTKILSDWLTTLSFLDNDENTSAYLDRLLDRNRQSSQILETLHGWVFEDVKRRTQTLYEQLWPIYLESKTSMSALENAEFEAIREAGTLKALMDNWSLFGRIQAQIADAITGVIEIYLTECFKKTGKKITEPIKSEITASFRQAISDISGRGHIPFQQSCPKMVDELSQVILKVLGDSQQLALQQARGLTSERLTFDTIKDQWSVKIGSQSYILKDDHIIIHVTPILQYLYNNITSRYGTWDSSYPISYSMSETVDPNKIVELSINEEIRKKWKLSEYRTIGLSKTPKMFQGKPIQPTVRVTPKTKIEPQPTPTSEDLIGWKNYIEASREDYKKRKPPIQPWEIQKHHQRREFLKEIKELRVADTSDDRKELRSKLDEVFKFKDRVFTMHKLPETQTDYLMERIVKFFKEYMTIISTIQNGLEEGKSRRFYLSDARTDLDFLKYPEKKYKKAHVRFLHGVHAKDWEQISSLMTNPLIINKLCSETDEDIIVKKLAFARDTKELVMISLILDNLSNLAIKNDLKYDNLSPDVFIGYYDKLASYLSHYKNIQVSLTDGKYESIGHVSTPFDSESVRARTNLNFQNSPSSWAIKSQYTDTWNSIITRFAQLFAEQLGPVFKMFDENMFDKLKELYLPSLKTFEQTRDYMIVIPKVEEPSSNVRNIQQNLPKEFSSRSTHTPSTTEPTTTSSTQEGQTGDTSSDGVIVSSRDLCPQIQKANANPQNQSNISDSVSPLSEPSVTAMPSITATVGEESIPDEIANTSPRNEPILNSNELETNNGESATTPHAVDPTTPQNNSSALTLSVSDFVITEDTVDSNQPAQNTTNPEEEQFNAIHEEFSSSSPITSTNTLLQQDGGIDTTL